MEKDLWSDRNEYEVPKIFRAKLIAIHEQDAHHDSTRHIGKVGMVKLTYYCLGSRWQGGDMYTDNGDYLLLNFARFERLEE